MNWMDDAACGELDPDLFFDPEREHEAKAVCRHCPVRDTCLDTALRDREPIGIWGGLTPQERRYMRRRRPPVDPRRLHELLARHGWKDTAA